MTIKTPFVCFLKGEKGTLDYVVPLNPNQEHFNFLREKIISLNGQWKTLSIQIFGSLSEAYLNFLKYVTKLKYPIHNEIEGNLYELFSIKNSECDLIIKSLKSNPDETIKKELGSFVVVGHLVEKQYVIFNTQSLSPKNMLTFKFPAHQKKLHQFINGE